PRGASLALEAHADRAVADEQHAHVVATALAQEAPGAECHVEATAHADGADVRADEALAEPEVAAHAGAVGPGVEHRDVDPGAPRRSGGWPRAPGPPVTSRGAAAYTRRPSHSSARTVRETRIAPTATIDSGQRSRTSSTKGRRRSAPTTIPATPQKNCGEVA